MSNEERQSYVYMAHVAEQAERYVEMAQVMKHLATSSPKLSGDERNMLNVAYKNAIGNARTALRIMQQHKNLPDHPKVNEYRDKLKKEVDMICNDVLDLVKNTLMGNTDDSDKEARVFYWKMAGDYNRYRAEFSSGDELKAASDAALENYDKGWTAAAELSSDHPVRLGLALNFSVFYYEVMDEHTKAVELARQAYNDGVAAAPSSNEEVNRDSPMILQLLRDNLAMWMTDDNDGNDGDLALDDVDEA